MIKDALDTVFVGYPANPKAGYWIPDIRQGNLVSGRIPDIKKRPDHPAGYPLHPYL
jgi:hypothetical protein